MTHRFDALFDSVRPETDGQKSKALRGLDNKAKAEALALLVGAIGMITGQVQLTTREDEILAEAFKSNDTPGPATGLGAVLSCLSLAVERGSNEIKPSEALLSSIFSHKYVDTYPPSPDSLKRVLPLPPQKIGKLSSGPAHEQHTRKSSRFDKLFADEAQGPVQGEAVHHSVGSTSGEGLDFGEGQLPQINPSSLTGPTERSEVGTQRPKGPRFRLTPPDAKSRRADDIRPTPVAKAEIPGWAYEKMYALCFALDTMEKRRRVTRKQAGRVGRVLRKLYDTGADLPRISEFGPWFRKWSTIHNPAPELVLEHWERAMVEIDEANKPPERTSPYPVRNHDYELTEAEAAEIDAKIQRGREIMGEV